MPRQLLYWVDLGTKSISRVNLDGRHRKTVVESNGYLDRPFGLAVFEVNKPLTAHCCTHVFYSMQINLEMNDNS